MAIDQGITRLINSGLSSPPFSNSAFQTMPVNASYPNYVFKEISRVRNTGLLFAFGLVAMRMEIQVNGSPSGQGADAIRLSEQINQILNGYAGTLPEGTIVSSCFQSDVIDIFDDAVRVYQRKMEYEINYSD